jgi:class 3 adenylate cyclase
MGTREYESSLTANENVEGSVAFIDICSFTAISEKETPDTVVQMLNKYFDLIVKEIITQNGTIDKFIGDCVMAVFKGEFHVDRAVDACLAIRDRINNLPAEHDFTPNVAIGINCGEMISGNIGSATLKRLDYTVIGDTVNTAQRLQSVATKGQVVISESCYQKIKQSFNCNPIGMTALKNKSAQVMLYEVMD